MEKVEAAEDTPEVFENDIELYLRIFCEENKIEDMTTQPQSIWNSALYYIYKNVFKGTNRLKDKTNRPIQNNDIISVSGEQLDACCFIKGKKEFRMRPLINIDGNIYALADASSINTGDTKRFGDGLVVNTIPNDSNDVVYVLVKNEVSEDIKEFINDNNSYMFDRFDIKEERIIRNDTITADDKIVDDTVNTANRAAAQTRNDSIVDDNNQIVCGS